jgi:hypothetical protein
MSPARSLVTEFRVNPGIGFDVIHLDITVLAGLAPPSINDQFVFLRQHGCCVSSTGQGRSPPYFLQFGPLRGFAVEHIQVVEGGPLVATTPMTTEHVHFPCMVVAGVVGPRLRGSDLTFGVFRLTAALLIRRLFPVELRQFEDVDIIESKVASVIASEDKQFVLANSTCTMLGSGLRNVS